VKTVAVLLIRFYQLAISPFIGKCCRFYPSCSEYGIEAIKAHGALYGIWLTAKRLGKCHPWHPGGIDEVPEKKKLSSDLK
jgi:putative membrane protein insertion efficiency factor